VIKKLSTAVSGADSNFPSPPANMVLGWAVAVGAVCATRDAASMKNAIAVFMMVFLCGSGCRFGKMKSNLKTQRPQRKATKSAKKTRLNNQG
jgi:hypothetical protein